MPKVAGSGTAEGFTETDVTLTPSLSWPLAEDTEKIIEVTLWTPERLMVVELDVPDGAPSVLRLCPARVVKLEYHH